MTELALGIVLLLGVLAYVLHPLLADVHAPTGRDDDELTDAQHRKRMALMALRDVEYDFHAGKLDESDYRAMKQEISAEALAAIDAEAVEWEARAGAAEVGGTPARTPDDVEAEVARIRAALREAIVCPSCAHANSRGQEFCTECGAALPRAD